MVKSFCQEAVCGIITGSLKGIFGINLFSQVEAEEIYRLKKLSMSGMLKPNIVPTDLALCQEIANGSSAALQTFMDQTSSSEIIAASALVVCEKAFLRRFKGVLISACLNLTGCITSKQIYLFGSNNFGKVKRYTHFSKTILFFILSISNIVLLAEYVHL